ncbi:uncharacterized protein BJX67DRAFT_386612 [Aspergillus lucknowensis]|uniref:Uncharacterized protein n=1 Tax=Aspergillus lucknowensis TaxID=176173 RepID=A0ABR4L5K3_9EURO
MLELLNKSRKPLHYLPIHIPRFKHQDYEIYRSTLDADESIHYFSNKLIDISSSKAAAWHIHRVCEKLDSSYTETIIPNRPVEFTTSDTSDAFCPLELSVPTLEDRKVGGRHPPKIAPDMRYLVVDSCNARHLGVLSTQKRKCYPGKISRTA